MPVMETMHKALRAKELVLIQGRREAWDWIFKRNFQENAESLKNGKTVLETVKMSESDKKEAKGMQPWLNT